MQIGDDGIEHSRNKTQMNTLAAHTHTPRSYHTNSDLNRLEIDSYPIYMTIANYYPTEKPQTQFKLVSSYNFYYLFSLMAVYFFSKSVSLQCIWARYANRISIDHFEVSLLWCVCVCVVGPILIRMKCPRTTMFDICQLPLKHTHSYRINI